MSACAYRMGPGLHPRNIMHCFTKGYLLNFDFGNDRLDVGSALTNAASTQWEWRLVNDDK